MKHTSRVKGFNGEADQLAENVGDLYYDSLADFLTSLSEKMKRDGDADFGRGRKNLASELYQCSDELKAASEHISKAWEICSPFVDEWLKKKGLDERP